MALDKKPFTFDRVARLAITALLLYGAVSLLDYLSDVLIPFTVAFLLAYLMNPLVKLVQRKVPRRAMAVFVSLIAVVVVLALAGWLIAPVIGKEISHMGQVVAGLVGQSDLSARLQEKLPPDLWEAIKGYASSEAVRDFVQSDSAIAAAKTAAARVLPGLWGLLSGTMSLLIGLVGLFVIILYLVFILLDYDQVSEGWKKLLPEPYVAPVTAFLKDVEQGMNRYFRAQAAVSALVGLIFAVGFWIIDLPLGVLLGLFIGLLNMVPYLPIVGLIPALGFAVIHAFETGGNVWTALALVALVFAVAQLLQDVVLTPRIMGKTMGLSPVLMLLSLSIWGKLLGMLGLLLALPLTVLFYAYYRRFLTKGGVGWDDL